MRSVMGYMAVGILVCLTGIGCAAQQAQPSAMAEEQLARRVADELYERLQRGEQLQCRCAPVGDSDGEDPSRTHSP